MALIALLTGLGFSYLHFVDVRSTRNMIVLGMAIIVAIAVTSFLGQNKDYIKTGKLFSFITKTFAYFSDYIILSQIFKKDNEMLTSTLTVLLHSPMFVGGLLACILDNVLPGTVESRGIKSWREHDNTNRNKTLQQDIYKLPFQSLYENTRAFKFLCRLSPLLPNFKVPQFTFFKSFSKK